MDIVMGGGVNLALVAKVAGRAAAEQSLDPEVGFA
jgi:hypothetical protein